MGSYNRITIAFFLLVCLVSVGRCTRRCGGDGLCRTAIAPTASSNASLTTPSTPTNSSTQPDSEFYTVSGTTIIIEKSNKTTPTQQTPTRSTSAPDSTNGTTQNVIGTTVSSKARSAGLEVTVHSSVTEATGTGTGVDVSTGGEGFTTGEVYVDVTSDGVDTTTGSLSEDLSKEGTTVGSEEHTNRLTVITTDYIIPNTDEWPTALQDGDVHVLPSTSKYTDTTNTPIQEIPGKVTTTTDSEMLTSALTTALGEQSTAHFASTPETLITSDRSTIATLTTSEGQTTSWLPPETAEKATTAPLQTSSLITSERSTTSVLHTLLPPTTPERATAAPLQTLRAKNRQRADAFPFRITTSTPTASTPTTSTLTTSEGETTSVLRTSLPPTTPERTTTAPLQTSIAKNCRGDLFLCRTTTSTPPASTPTASTPTASTPTTSTLTTSEGETTSVLHTSPPPAERTTTAQQPTSSSRASTASPSTTHVAQTTAHDESQESRGDESQESPEDDSMNQISWTDLAEEDRENILTLSFNDITVVDWMMNYDLKFRQFLSKILTTNTLRVVPGNIYYIEPTPFQRGDILYVSVLPRYSSMKRSAQRPVPLDVIVEALGNMTALADALGIDTLPSIVEGVAEFLLPTQLPTTLPTKDLPKIQPSTTEPPIIQPSTTRKPPQEIGFLSNPGLFISLVVIATVSIIIIIVGLIYLLCDRRRGRTGEYITNHTPRNSDLELGLDNPVMAENDKNVSNGNHLSSIKGDMESDMIVPYDNFTQEELMNYEVEDTHL